MHPLTLAHPLTLTHPLTLLLTLTHSLHIDLGIIRKAVSRQWLWSTIGHMGSTNNRHSIALVSLVISPRTPSSLSIIHL